jgi:hypothetical protein
MLAAPPKQIAAAPAEEDVSDEWLGDDAPAPLAEPMAAAEAEMEPEPEADDARTIDTATPEELAASIEQWAAREGEVTGMPAADFIASVCTFEHGGKTYAKATAWFLGGADAAAKAQRVAHLRAICKRLAADDTSGYAFAPLGEVAA